MRQILSKPDAIKAQALADFVAEMTLYEEAPGEARYWTLHVDESIASTNGGLVLFCKTYKEKFTNMHFILISRSLIMKLNMRLY